LGESLDHRRTRVVRMRAKRASIVERLMREIIEFWRAVEMFSPPAIPAARPAQRVFDVALGEPLPWNPGHPVQVTRLTKDQAWRHTVYVGLYPREAVFSALKDVFPPAP